MLLVLSLYLFSSIYQAGEINKSAYEDGRLTVFECKENRKYSFEYNDTALVINKFPTNSIGDKKTCVIRCESVKKINNVWMTYQRSRKKYFVIDVEKVIGGKNKRGIVIVNVESEREKECNLECEYNVDEEIGKMTNASGGNKVKIFVDNVVGDASSEIYIVSEKKNVNKVFVIKYSYEGGKYSQIEKYKEINENNLIHIENKF